MSDMEYSCGAVVFSLQESSPRYLLVYDSHFGFPKGHMEKGETEEETALREVYEETGLQVKLDTSFREVICYELPKKPGVYKQVTFFLTSFDPRKQGPSARNEISRIVSVDYEDAIALLWHEELKRVLKKAHERICINLDRNGIVNDN